MMFESVQCIPVCSVYMFKIKTCTDVFCTDKNISAYEHQKHDTFPDVYVELAVVQQFVQIKDKLGCFISSYITHTHLYSP